MGFYAWTGNPFVDAGIAAIQEWSNRSSPESVTLDDIKYIASELPSLYTTDAWKKNLFSIFPNNPVTNPSVKDKGKRMKELLDNLIVNIEQLGTSGDCIACGRRTVKSQKNRMHIPMTGYDGSHFFSFKTDGADYCDACTFAVQCSPLAFYACGKLVLLHSNSYKVMRYWAKRCVAVVQKQVASRNYTGCFNEKFTNPMNALFHIIQDLILSYEERWVEENATIRIYHFTNYLQSPELDMYNLPAPVFRFLVSMRHERYFGDWMSVVRRGYYFTKGGKEISISVGGKSEGDYKNSKNKVYQNLLSGQSILGFFFNVRKKLGICLASEVRRYQREGQARA